MANGALNVRTPGEELWIWRRAMGFDQAQAGQYFYISEDAYWRAESDIGKKLDPEPVEPTLGDLCALARRRHGLTMHATARLLGMSHVTLAKRERAGCRELVKAWKGLGYRFPR